MSKAQTFHVVPHDGAWAIRKKTGGSISVFDSKSAAIDEARKRARSQHNTSRIVVHGKSGQIIQNTAVKGELTEKVIRDAIRAVDKTENGFSGITTLGGGSKVVRARKR